MIKIAIVSMLFAVTVTGQEVPSSPYEDIIKAAKYGDWDKFQALLYKKFRGDGWKEVSSSNIKDLKPPGPGGHVYGESEVTYHSSSNIGGEKTVESGGHKIVNEDGKIQEFDFKPNGDPFLALQKDSNMVHNIDIQPMEANSDYYLPRMNLHVSYPSNMQPQISHHSIGITPKPPIDLYKNNDYQPYQQYV